jgi:hypothetical protein
MPAANLASLSNRFDGVLRSLELPESFPAGLLLRRGLLFQCELQRHNLHVLNGLRLLCLLRSLHEGHRRREIDAVRAAGSAGHAASAGASNSSSATTHAAGALRQRGRRTGG